MKKTYFNINDFEKYSSEIRKGLVPSLENLAYDSACGRQEMYDVFLSHSSKDKAILRKIRTYIEERLGFSAYIDWEEDEDDTRPATEIAPILKDAMQRSKKFLIVKTKNSDLSSWVSWETGYFDKKDANSIGVLFVEEDDFSYEDFKHQEYLTHYEILGNDELESFLNGGVLAVKEQQTKMFNENFTNKKIGLVQTGGILGLENVDNTGVPTKFYGEK